jgi:hypothetical protein
LPKGFELAKLYCQKSLPKGFETCKAPAANHLPNSLHKGINATW